jgi:alanine racemase
MALAPAQRVQTQRPSEPATQARASATGTPLPRLFKPRRTTPADVVRPTRAEISLSNLRANLRALSRRCPAPVWCVLKADGYGHGAKACARTLERAGAKGVCVAWLEDGIELRNAGIGVPICCRTSVSLGFSRRARRKDVRAS